MKKIVFLMIVLFILFISPTFRTAQSILPVFHFAKEPVAITKGMNGTALTMNISFGDDALIDWISQLKEPYPLLFIDLEWAKRYPFAIERIIQKNISVGLLGSPGEAYEKNEQLFEKQWNEFEEIFHDPPLWFRTQNEYFPASLLQDVQSKQVNAIGSTIVWNGKPISIEGKGEIVSISSYKDQQVDLQVLQKWMDKQTFDSIEQVLFNIETKTKKMPK